MEASRNSERVVVSMVKSLSLESKGLKVGFSVKSSMPKVSNIMDNIDNG